VTQPSTPQTSVPTRIGTALPVSSTRILVALAGGIGLGIFLGDLVAPLHWVAEAYVKLLQMTVLPYVTVSIIGGLGRLRLGDARVLGTRTMAVLATLWGLAVLYMFLIPLAFPGTQNASFFSTTLIEKRTPFNFIDLYIPSNPFRSLADNVVPAVVLFAVLVGVALITVERKHVVLDLLHVCGEALARVARMVIQLTPYGLFAIAATAAGTMTMDQFGRLQIYIVIYVMVTLLIALWVLPGLIAALTEIPIRAVFAVSHNAVLTAFAAGDLFIVLPGLIEAARTLVAERAPGDAQASTLPDVIVPASFNFPHTAKLVSLSFVLFAAWFSDARIHLADYPRLAVTAFLASFGSLNIAVPFLLDLFRIPADTFQLFLASGVINAHFGTLLAAMHTLTVGVLGACATAGLLHIRRRRLLRYLAVTTALTVGLVAGSRAVFANAFAQPYTKDQVLRQMHLLHQAADVVVHRTRPDHELPAQGDVLDTIRARGKLRVGYLPNALPFAFFNERRELVGYDIELAHQLANDLRVHLELVPVDRGQLTTDLAHGYCDIIMSGVPVTTDLASSVRLSNAYLDETMAFVVPDSTRDQFTTWDAIQSRASLTIAVPDVSYYVEKLRTLVPNATVRPMQDVTSVLKSSSPDVDAIALPAERGSAWTLIYPAYSVVIPEPGLLKVPLAYPIARLDRRFGEFVNTWIELKRKDGTLDALYRYWILGQERGGRRPRWSVIRDVLHWVR
jgi:Na+/H+-dicarboxylate symporter/ABC-type amino acid transport substrate-binding protein